MAKDEADRVMHLIYLARPSRHPFLRAVARVLVCALVLSTIPAEALASIGRGAFTPTYFPMGRRETATDSRGTTSYTYDNRDRVETTTYPDGRSLTYGYDTQGNRTSLTADVGGQTLTTSYGYDELNRLDLVTDSESRIYDHGYDEVGNRQSLALPNGVNTDYVYDDLNRLTDLTTVGPAGAVQSYHFTLGTAGNREQIDEADGTIRANAYDDLYRRRGETVTDDVGATVYSKTFVYDPVGNRETQTTVGAGTPGTPTAPGTIGYGYDDRDRITTEDAQAYGWDDNGNLTGKNAEAAHEWDYENRLTQVTLADGTTVEHIYDAYGNRVQTITTPPDGPVEVVNLLVDTSGVLSHLVAETASAGVLIAEYVRGDDLLAVIRPSGARFFHADRVGSIRALTDASGNGTDTYDYTAFGELLSHAGTATQPYAFTGEPLDANSGFQYHRARWLQPGVGRFTGMDPFEGVALQPITLHRYGYASQAPVDNIDPSGEFFSATQIAVAAPVTVSTLAAVTVFNASNTILRGAGFSKRSSINITTQPIVAENSGWSDGDVATSLVTASRVWAAQSSIHVSALPIIHVNDPLVNSGSNAILNWLWNRRVEQFDRVLDRLPNSAKHISVFVARISGTNGFGSINWLPESRHFGRSFTFVANHRWWTLAHEWGHTFGRSHQLAFGWIPFSSNLMNPFIVPDTGGLNPAQVSAARAVARTYE